MKEVKTFTAHIYMAGCIEQAKNVCREYCAKGLCVTIEPVEYIYTGGEEHGFRIGLINYPRFPSDPDSIRQDAIGLSELLRSRLYQHSYSIVFSDNTLWESYRESAKEQLHD